MPLIIGKILYLNHIFISDYTFLFFSKLGISTYLQPAPW